jgi:hypothetical protein
VLCEEVFRGWELVGRPPPSHYSVGIHGCMLLGGGFALDVLVLNLINFVPIAPPPPPIALIQNM